MGEFIPGVTSLSSRRQQQGGILSTKIRSHATLICQARHKAKMGRALPGVGAEGVRVFWEHFTPTVAGLPEVKLSLLVFFFHCVIIRELLSRQMLNLLLLHLAFQNNE